MPSPLNPPSPSAAPQRWRGHEHPLFAVALVVLLVGLVSGAAYVVSEEVDPIHHRQRARWTRLMAEAPAVEAILLGNSHGGALSSEALGLRGWHGWSEGADYYEALHIVRSAQPALPNLRYVFVPVSPITYDNASTRDRAERREDMYAMTGNYWPVAGDWRVALQALLAPVVRDDNWEGVALELKAQLNPGPRTTPRTAPPQLAGQDAAFGRQTSSLPRLSASMTPEVLEWYHAVNDAVERGLPAPPMTPAALEWDVTLRLKHYRNVMAAARAYDPKLCENARRNLRAIAEAAAPARVVFFTPPYSSPYLRAVDPSWGCGLRRYAAALAAEAPNVSYFDDHAMEGFTDDSGYFKNADHLNTRGVRLYSSRVAARLGLSRPAKADGPAP